MAEARHHPEKIKRFLVMTILIRERIKLGDVFQESTINFPDLSLMCELRLKINLVLCNANTRK